jgi:putative transposase
MPRTRRFAPGGVVYHVLNRGVGRMTLFRSPEDYRALLRVVGETLRAAPMRICAFSLMPNHWHFVLWPEADGQLAAFMQRLTNTHVQRWQRHRRRVGYGHVYQGRYKSFPVQDDAHFYQVVRYVERNALRANLVSRAEHWPWSSLASRKPEHADETWPLVWPLPRPADWVRHVNRAQSEAEVEAIRRSLRRGRPLGQSDWVEQTAKRLGLESTLRDRGRPKKSP